MWKSIRLDNTTCVLCFLYFPSERTMHFIENGIRNITPKIPPPPHSRNSYTHLSFFKKYSNTGDNYQGVNFTRTISYIPLFRNQSGSLQTGYQDSRINEYNIYNVFKILEPSATIALFVLTTPLFSSFFKCPWDNNTSFIYEFFYIQYSRANSPAIFLVEKRKI